MHLFEFALRDLLHSERHMAPWGLIAIDDIYPCHPVQASRRRRSGSWTGDVWKLVPILRQHRPISEPPAEVLERHGAIPSSHTLVMEFLQMLIQARREQWLVRQVQVALAGLRPRIAAAEQACCGRVRELSQEPCLLPDPAGA